LKIRSTESTCAGGSKRSFHVGVRVLHLWVLLCPQSREAAEKVAGVGCEALSRQSSRTTLGARKERNLNGPCVLHDGGVSHGSSDDPIVHAPVLLRPPGEALLPRGRCEPHDICQHVVLRTKLETHVIMKSHINVICLQYHSLPLCWRSGLGAPGTSRPAESCRGLGQVAVAG
jgi:hypothetical protein